jgi:hypothetical protein
LVGERLRVGPRISAGAAAPRLLHGAAWPRALNSPAFQTLRGGPGAPHPTPRPHLMLPAIMRSSRSVLAQSLPSGPGAWSRANSAVSASFSAGNRKRAPAMERGRKAKTHRPNITEGRPSIMNSHWGWGRAGVGMWGRVQLPPVATPGGPKLPCVCLVRARLSQEARRRPAPTCQPLRPPMPSIASRPAARGAPSI